MRNFKKTLATTLSAAALAVSLQACSTYGDTAAPAAPAFVPTGDGPALWKVADEDTTIYLFGTVHALPSDINWYAGPVKTAIDGSGSLVTEVDLTPENMAAMGPLTIQKASLPEGQTLRGLMNDEQRAAYEAGMAKAGLPAPVLDQLDRFEPWFAAITVMQILLQKGGIDGSNGVEKVLEETVPAGTERVALETVEFQLDIFDSLPVEKQLVYLLEVLENPDAGVAMLSTIIDEWKVGDVTDLATMLFENAEDDPVLMERLFYARNANWAGWIDERLDTPGTVFMAVGAGHLAGEKSVQDYLATRDIAVTRIQ